jgi:DNA-binding NarL/FixJ family response regulator
MNIAPGIVGRGAELAALQAFVADADAGVGCLVLEGAPGVGKSALWEAAVASARERGITVLSCRPSAEETRFDFSGVADLFGGVPDTVLARLPAPQARALEAALLLGDGDGDADVRAVSVGTLSVVRSLVAGGGALLIALDDVQWLDSASAGALTFALRRLRTEPVRVLATRRVPGTSPTAVERVLRPTVLSVAPMSFADISRLVQSRLGVTFSRATSRRIYERSGGNPLFALELARVVTERGGRVDAADDLPLPAAVEAALTERLSTLTSRVRRVLLVAELAGSASAIELGHVVDADSVDEAVAAGVVSVTAGWIRPSHPLLGTAAVAGAQPAELRDLHKAMARAALDAEHAARHLALARRHPDEETAAIVASAAEHASRRGAAASAAELGEYALRLTPPAAPAWAERLLASCQYSLVAGQLGRVRELLTDSVDRLPDAASRARALILLVDADADAGSQTAETPCLVRALAEADGNPRLRSQVYQRLTMHGAIAQVTYIGKAAEWAAQAVRLAAAAGDPAGELTALTRLMWTRHMRAESSDAELARYRMLAHVTAPALVQLSADRGLAVRGIWRGELADARASVNSLLALSEARGEAESYFIFRVHLCELEVRAGRWQVVRALLDDWAVEQEEPVGNSASHVRVRAQLAVGLGQVEEAKRLAADAIGLAIAAGTHWHRLEGLRALGMAESLAGEHAAAVGHLAQVWEHTHFHGVVDPGVFPVAPELVEALAAVGDVGRALEVTEEMEAFAGRHDHPWASAAAARCRGLVLLAQRRDADAVEALRAAADQFAKLDMRFDAARTLITLGVARRRLKRLRDGREALQTASAIFAELGSDGWVTRARTELERFGGRRTADGLTPTEERVAELVASGQSNKQVAHELVVSVSAVERHLTRIYEKLGVRSRAELIRRRAAPGESVG